jgi:putative FmdB family regulatory protein
MPVYAYKCRDCSTPLEVHQDFSDTALTDCPHCGGTLRKQYGSIGVTFNGSGFYRTDSRAGAAKTDGASGSDSGGKSDGGKTDGAKKDGGKKESAPKADTAPKTAAPAASAS